MDTVLKDKKIIIASFTHLRDGVATTIGGSGIALCEYLRRKGSTLMCIWQPMPLSEDLSVRVQVFKDGDLARERSMPIPNWPFGRGKAISLIYLLLKIRDVFSVLYFVIFAKERYEKFIGVEALNASVGVFLRRLGVVHNVIYFNLDYGVQRFPHSLLNLLFHWLDKFAVHHADYTWCLSAAMIEGRLKRGYAKERMSPQIVVPIGVNFSRIKRLPFEDIDKKNIVYLGLQSEHQGVELIF
jgi:glycosyltransferase involved in cell wall biosynthesis